MMVMMMMPIMLKMKGRISRRGFLARPPGPHCVRACAVETMSRFHKCHFLRKFGGKMPCSKTAPHTLCEPEQSKRMSISQEPLFTEIYKNAAPQNLGADFVRACAVETHVKISQEPLLTEIYG